MLRTPAPLIGALGRIIVGTVERILITDRTHLGGARFAGTHPRAERETHQLTQSRTKLYVSDITPWHKARRCRTRKRVMSTVAMQN